jgi:hypothetical protein
VPVDVTKCFPVAIERHRRVRKVNIRTDAYRAFCSRLYDHMQTLKVSESKLAQKC